MPASTWRSGQRARGVQYRLRGLALMLGDALQQVPLAIARIIRDLFPDPGRQGDRLLRIVELDLGKLDPSKRALVDVDHPDQPTIRHDMSDRHWQVVEAGAVLDRAVQWRAGSPSDLDAGLLAPDPEGLVAGTAVLHGGHQVPPRSEIAVDHGVRRQEPLRLPG